MSSEYPIVTQKVHHVEIMLSPCLIVCQFENCTSVTKLFFDPTGEVVINKYHLSYWYAHKVHTNDNNVSIQDSIMTHDENICYLFNPRKKCCIGGTPISRPQFDGKDLEELKSILQRYLCIEKITDSNLRHKLGSSIYYQSISNNN